MDQELDAADEYIQYIRTALKEAAGEIGIAASTFVENSDQQRRLGKHLGQARNALARAMQDLNAHEMRLSKQRSISAAEQYLSFLNLAGDEKTEVVVAVVPLPLDDERLMPTLFAERAFHNDFTHWVTRFNNERRQHTAVSYLLEVPGGVTPNLRGDHFEFTAIPQGAKETTQVGLLYTTGAFVFKRRLHSPWSDPSSYHLGYVIDELRATIAFVWWLYEELRIVPRSIAVQAALTNVGEFHMSAPSTFPRLGALDLIPKPGVKSFVAPAAPFVALFGPAEKIVDRLVIAVESAIRSNYEETET